jgi:hypothetical protein
MNTEQCQQREIERERRLAAIREQIDNAMNDPRPSRTDEQVARRLRELHEETVKAKRRGG